MPSRFRIVLILGVIACGSWLMLTAPMHAQNPRPNRPRDPVRPTNRAAKPADPGDINLTKSRVYIRVGKIGLGHEHGVVGKLRQGAIHLDAPEAADSLVFEMSSFEADTIDARNYVGLSGTTDESTRKQVNANLRGPNVLNVREFPTAAFAVKSITKVAAAKPTAPPQYQISGDFTLHGTTRPIVVQANGEKSGEWTRLRGSFAILQSEFGITPFTKAFGAVGVADELQIWGDFWVANPR